ncbi:MAG: hypothetical protein ACYS0E_03785 [Planctomycetota bacterium]|jgi:hypothetical protein
MSEFLSRNLAAAVLRIDGGDETGWAAAARELELYPEDDVELFVAIDDKDVEALRAITLEWDSGKRALPVHDRNLLKRALKAFRKRLRIVRLDSESSVGGGPMSSGKESSIVGVRAPEQFPAEVWDLLVKQGRLLEGRDGMYELPD